MAGRQVAGARLPSAAALGLGEASHPSERLGLDLLKSLMLLFPRLTAREAGKLAETLTVHGHPLDTKKRKSHGHSLPWKPQAGKV